MPLNALTILVRASLSISNSWGLLYLDPKNSPLILNSCRTTTTIITKPLIVSSTLLPMTKCQTLLSVSNMSTTKASKQTSRSMTYVLSSITDPMESQEFDSLLTKQSSFSLTIQYLKGYSLLSRCWTTHTWKKYMKKIWRVEQFICPSWLNHQSE